MPYLPILVPVQLPIGKRIILSNMPVMEGLCAPNNCCLMLLVQSYRAKSSGCLVVAAIHLATVQVLLLVIPQSALSQLWPQACV